MVRAPSRVAAVATLTFSSTVAVVASGAGVASAGAGSAATTDGEAAFAVTSSSGWITYNGTEASKLPLINPQTVTVSGTVNSSGQCVLPNTTQVPKTVGDTFFESETAFDPVICQAKYLEGEVSASTAAADLGTNLYPTRTAPLTPSAVPSTVLSTPPTSASITSVASSGLMARAAVGSVRSYKGPSFDNTTYESAYQKDAYIDPLDITITSLAQNMTWGYTSGYIAGNVSAYVVPYRFAYDGWSGGGPSSSVYKNGTATAAINLAYYQSVNTDFEQYLEDVLGPGAIAVCGFTIAPAVFTENMALTGYANHSYSVNSDDTATGGCSDLVHRDSENGWGSTS